MANSIRLDDYEQAKTLAEAVRGNAEKINDSFDASTGKMNKLLDSWRSEGAEESLNLYSDISKTFPAFYERIISDTDTIIKVCDSYFEADVASKNNYEKADA